MLKNTAALHNQSSSHPSLIFDNPVRTSVLPQNLRIFLGHFSFITINKKLLFQGLRTLQTCSNSLQSSSQRRRHVSYVCSALMTLQRESPRLNTISPASLLSISKSNQLLILSIHCVLCFPLDLFPSTLSFMIMFT